LLFSQLVTLYLTPVFFTYMAQVQRWLARTDNNAEHGSEIRVPIS